jgi:hypothetical protein
VMPLVSEQRCPMLISWNEEIVTCVTFMAKF